MTSPENPAHEPEPSGAEDLAAEVLPAVAEPPPADEAPAWADVEAFVETAEEPAYDAWVREQDLSSVQQPRHPDEPSAPDTEPEPEVLPVPEPAVPTEPVPDVLPAQAPETLPEPYLPELPSEPPVEAAVEAAEVEAAEVAPVPTLEPPAEPEPEPEVEPAPVVEPELEPAAVEEPEAVDAAVPAAGRGWTGLLAGVVALLVLAGATLGVLAWRSAGAGSLQADRESALDAARSAARVVFSYDYRHLTQDFAAGRAVTTGAFRAEYERTTGKLVQDVAPRYKAVVVAEVSSAAVVDAHAGRVLVLAFVNQESTSTLAAAPKITQSRLEMTMVERGGHWLISTIRAF